MDWDNLDFTDPCALIGQLKPVLFKLSAGAAEEEIEGSDGRRVKFHRGSIPQLRTLISELERECKQKTSGRRRYALRGRFS